MLCSGGSDVLCSGGIDVLCSGGIDVLCSSGSDALCSGEIMVVWCGALSCCVVAYTILWWLTLSCGGLNSCCVVV